MLVAELKEANKLTPLLYKFIYRWWYARPMLQTSYPVKQD